MKKQITFVMLAVLWAMAPLSWAKNGEKEKKLTPIEIYIRDASAAQSAAQPTAGSLYSSTGFMANLSRDARASQVNDIVTILVSDRATAVSRGVTATSRDSDADASITSLAGPTKTLGALSNLLGLSSSQALESEGETSRETVLQTTISARVTHVMPNGYLVLEGMKDIRINSENQQVRVRGVARWTDVGPANTIGSDRLANLEVQVNGKGVVGDAIRRPNFLYRILLGILPF
jgi:flagellar L-ring protein FlgH